MKSPDDTLFVTHNYDILRDIAKRFSLEGRSFIGSTDIRRKIGNPKNIVLDEYLFFENKKEVYETIKVSGVENLYIFTSTDKAYNDELFNIVRDGKQTHSCDELIEKYAKNDIYKSQQIIDLYYNFITDNITLVDIDFNPKSIEDRSHLIDLMGKDNYDMEILNIWKK